MTNSPKVGRNDSCPCGSGLKFKNCCEGKTQQTQSNKRSPSFYVVVAVVGIGVAIVLGQALFTTTPTKQPGGAVGGSPASTPVQWPAPVTTSTALTPQPPGPVPEGKVWSPEHGHWHDIATGGVNTATPAPAPALTPQPPGPVPEGKVWSPEHGHWHDIPAQPAAPAQP